MILGISVAFITRVQRDTHNIQSIVILYTRFCLESFSIGNSIHGMVFFLFEKRCGIRQSFLFVAFGLGWLRERENQSMIVKEKPFRLTRETRYLEIWLGFRLSFFFEMCCDFFSVWLPPKQKISMISIFGVSALYDIILNLISVEIYRFKEINIEKQSNCERENEKTPAIDWNPSQAWPKSIQTNSFALISIAISFKKWWWT